MSVWLGPVSWLEEGLGKALQGQELDHERECVSEIVVIEGTGVFGSGLFSILRRDNLEEGEDLLTQK